MACVHSGASDLSPPGPSQAVYREDCTQCFDSIDNEAGLNVCLHCFNGGCAGDRDHALLHFKRYGHSLALNIRRTPKQVQLQRDEPPPKISKLAIAAETEDDRYNIVTSVVCYSCPREGVDKTTGNLPTVIEGIMTAMTFSKREEIKAWEQEFVPCEHTLCLTQQDVADATSKDSSQCSACDLNENLWLCLECGNTACGRSQFGGTRGNSHALAHADATSHAVAVKLGSITAEGSADVYCYKCNEERTDPELANHLAHWGIYLAGREKTEKSLMEMQVEHNLTWDFSMTTEDGRELVPVFGPGFTGLANLGNSCYLSSVMQCIFSTEGFQSRYYHPSEEPPLCQAPAQDLETQLRKLADGLLSGRYSQPDPRAIASAATSEAPLPPHQKGLAPSMFKYLIGQGHEEFSTMRQQDAFEFLLHLFKSVSLSKHVGNQVNPVQHFRFEIEQRLQCLNCRKVRYKVDEQDNISVAVPARRVPGEADQFESVTLSECLDIFTADEIVELTCPGCESQDGFSKRSAFKTLPQELTINARRFELVKWVPTKLDIPVVVGDQPLDFGPYLAGEHDPNEELLPERTETTSFIPNREVLDQLLSMGFPAPRCEKALHATGNSDPEAAMNWLFAHMEDPDIDKPIVLDHSAGRPEDMQQDESKIAQLGEMGIEVPRARRALAATDGDVNRALDWVFSHPDDDEMEESHAENDDVQARQGPIGYDTLPAQYRLRSIVCHKGTSVHAGHYVAFIRKTLKGETSPSWVLFNDEKVVKCEKIEDMKKTAYMYFFTRA
ncbi:Ubiquitin carboxyl-terminal hydrolase 14 [Penicillium canariense]|uniref:Ubiquitin carboxyl-terminal hydrolase n=1 Tax=Penicillium canariense TaxID=189055 RepID=A0A9W9HNQ3_9EURO|nr:Ubiquitin carboxyl-terminal hydrolase 14 [Penicillium canariense]KAJ5150974.1 Ubiquitin carboxyl-terminal hydrolase 14 [Penicillium canariense]